ncbi:hypothetical protein [Longirhabdus pacifica]|uniref:hypothetical protein n=1 Tax=Longirhabdus pacifica TaxID=2305227 RepID=UPI0010086BA8|nr:hypothetical protein [Longirhabdus pacifica]
MKKRGYRGRRKKGHNIYRYFLNHSNRRRRKKKHRYTPAPYGKRKRYTVYTPKLGKAAKKRIRRKIRIFANKQLGKNRQVGRGRRNQNINNINNANKMRWFGYGQIGMPRVLVIGKRNKPRIKIVQNIKIGRVRYVQDEFFDINYNA